MFGGKWSLYEYALFHVHYEGHGRVLTRNLSWTNKTDGISRLSGTENVYVNLTGMNVEINFSWFARNRRALAR